MEKYHPTTKNEMTKNIPEASGASNVNSDQPIAQITPISPAHTYVIHVASTNMAPRHANDHPYGIQPSMHHLVNPSNNEQISNNNHSTTLGYRTSQNHQGAMLGCILVCVGITIIIVIAIIAYSVNSAS
mmetsp:Transcript_19095/g.19227  ORF Transcript_19095/g.19227 Transcript_19095/m.19227 type:complete len:129 (+) Transcript_19095:53-439(+)